MYLQNDKTNRMPADTEPTTTPTIETKGKKPRAKASVATQRKRIEVQIARLQEKLLKLTEPDQ